MSKTGILTLMVLFLSLHDAKGKPLLDHDVVVNSELIRKSRSFGLNFHGEPHSHCRYLVPISTFSFSNLFKDDTTNMAVLMNKVETMEKNQDKILKLLTELTEAPKATSCVFPSVPTPNEHSKIEPENIVDLPSDELNPLIINIPIIEEGTHEDTNQHQTSDSKNEVKNEDPLSIVSNENNITSTQITNVEVVEPLEPVNSTAKLDSNENTDKEVDHLLHSNSTKLEKPTLVSEKLENYTINEEGTHEDTNQHQMSDSKNEVKNDEPLSIVSNENEDPLSIVTNENDTTSTQITNVEVVEPLEPVNSTAKLDSNENTDKEVDHLLHSNSTKLEKPTLVSEKLENYTINEEGTHEDTNQHQMSDSKNEVKNDEPLSIVSNENEDPLSIVSNENDTTSIQITNVEVVEPLEPVNSTAKLDSNENTDKEVDHLLHSNSTKLEKPTVVSEKLENYTINEEESTENTIKEVNEENN